MDQIALYYPYISPGTAWLKQSLLMFETVSSIIAPGTGTRSDDLEWLASEGIWVPTYVDLAYDAAYRDEVETALLEFADNDNYRIGASISLSRSGLMRMYERKLAEQLERSMVDLDLAIVERRGGDLLVHAHVAAIVLAITAKYLAASYRHLNSRMIPSTDLPIFEKIAYDPLSGSQTRFRCLELLLDGLMPIPEETVSFPDIIDFRENHRDELGRLNAEVGRMLRIIESSEDPFDEIRSMRAEIEQSVTDIKAAANSRRIRLAAGSCSVLALGALAGATFHADTLHWVFDGFGGAAVATAMDRLVRGRPNNDNFAYLLSARSSFGT
jgi:hypothetical protein